MDDEARRQFGDFVVHRTGALIGYVLAVTVTFAYFYPIYTSRTLTYTQWYARMWLGGRWY